MIRILVIALGLFALLVLLPQGSEPATAQDVEVDVQDEDDPVRLALKELHRLNEVLTELRQQLARAELEATACNQELQELRQFIVDSNQLGPDFQQYKAVREAAERESQFQQQEFLRQGREQEKADRAARMQQARAERERRRAEQDRLAFYRRRGFSHLSLDVFLG